MSKYELLWKYIKKQGKDDITLSFKEIKDILSFELDHSFLNYRSELKEYGYEAVKISIKNKTISFKKMGL